MDSGLAPGLHFARVDAPRHERIVQRERVAGNETGRHFRGTRQRRRIPRESGVGDGHEIAVLAGGGRRQHQRDAIDDERLHDPVHEALAQPEEIQIAVQIAREADERAAIVVAIAVVHAVERRLNRALQRPQQQGDDDRGEEGDDGLRTGFAAEEHFAGELEEHGVDGRHPRQRGGVAEPALDDDLDVHQAVAHDGGRKGQRHESQQDRRELGAPDRIEAEREGQGVARRQTAPRRARSPTRSSGAADAR